MRNFRKDRTKMLLINASGQKKEFVDIIAFHKVLDNSLFEYKFIFNGVPWSQPSFIKNGLVGGKEGLIRKDTEKTPFEGNAEIGIHFDGNAMYKDAGKQKNFKATRLPQINKIIKPIHFLRITGICFDMLIPHEHTSSKKVGSVITMQLPQSLENPRLTIDFWFSSKQYEVKSFFSDAEHYTFVDDNEHELALTAHIYEADQNKTVCIIVPPNTLWAKIYSTYYYYKLKIKSLLQSIHNKEHKKLNSGAGDET